MAEEQEELRRVDRKRMRTGFTTGACATAAAKGATITLLTGKALDEVTIHLPIGEDHTFPLHARESGEGWALCSVVKDAGDDPDVTHGAEIRATVRLGGGPGVHLRAGEGVGTVTLPGLGLEVGGPAINPVPRQMITEAVTAVARDTVESEGLTVEVSVPGGEAMARKTLNGRLGILGGISILGTTGIVVPYSASSWIASVEQAIDVAAANGQRRVVLSTGGRGERFARAVIDLPAVAFVETGPFTGRALRRARKNGMERVTLAGMVGKFAKLAQGNFQTHARESQVDPAFLASLAEQAGAGPDLVARIAGANTARHVAEMVSDQGLPRFFTLLTEAVANQAREYIRGALRVDAILFDFNGEVLARAGDE